MSELDADHDGLYENQTEEDAANEPTPQSWTVCVYLVDKAYGGHEEGGWWYPCGEIAVEFWKLTKVFEEETLAYEYALELNEKHPELREANSNRRSDLNSVLCEGRYVAEVHGDMPPRAYPTEPQGYS